MMLTRHTRRIAAGLLACSLFAWVPSPTNAQSTPAERKAAAEQKKREADEKRRAAEEQRKAKAEQDKAIAARDYDFPDHGIAFKTPLGWQEATVAAADGGQGIAMLVSLDYSPPNLPKAPEGVQVFKPHYTVQILAVPENETLDAFLEHTSKSLVTPDARLKIAPAKDTTVANQPAKLVMGMTKPNDARPETVRQLITINGRKGYVFQLVTPHLLQGRAVMAAEQIERSVKFADVAAPQVAQAPASQPSAEPVAVDRPADRYQLTGPAGWKLWPESGVSTTFLRSTGAKDGKAATIRVYRRSTRFDSTSAAEFATWAKRQTTSTYDAPVPTKVDGVDALAANGKANDESFAERVIVFTRGTDAYAIQLSHDIAEATETPDALNGMVASFKFTGDAPIAKRPTTVEPKPVAVADADDADPDVEPAAAGPKLDHAALAKLAEEKVGQWVAFKSDQLPLALEYPDGWTRHKNDENLEIALRLTQPGLAKRSRESTISMITFDRQSSIFRNAKASAEMFGMLMTGGKKLQLADTTLAGKPATRGEGSGVDANGRQVNVVVIAAEADAYVLMATLAATEGDYEAWLPHFERLVKSVQWP